MIRPKPTGQQKATALRRPGKVAMARCLVVVDAWLLIQAETVAPVETAEWVAVAQEVAGEALQAAAGT
jgi:hypothetical protein